MTTKLKTSLTAMFLLAVAVLVPACDLTRACNPDVEMCVFTGNHPGGLDGR